MGKDNWKKQYRKGWARKKPTIEGKGQTVCASASKGSREWLKAVKDLSNTVMETGSNTGGCNLLSDIPHASLEHSMRLDPSVNTRLLTSQHTEVWYVKNAHFVIAPPWVREWSVTTKPTVFPPSQIGSSHSSCMRVNVSRFLFQFALLQEKKNH